MALNKGDEVKREYKTTYNYSISSGLGSMFETNPTLSISAYNGHISDYSYKLAVSIHHPNYFCVGVDVKGGNYLHLKPREDFSKYMLSRGVGSLDPPIRMYYWRDNDESIVSHPYISPKFRKIIRGMISFVRYLHYNHEASLESLDIKNLAVVDDGDGDADVVQFCGINFIPQSEDSFKNDWRALKKLLIDHVFHGWLSYLPPEELPEELINLLEMLADADEGCEFHLLNHLAILDPTQKLNFVKEARVKFHSFRGTYKENDFQSAVESMCVTMDWPNAILKSPRLPPPVLKCLSKWRRTYKVENEEQLISKWKRAYKVKNEELLQCVWNFSVHLPKYIDEYKDLDGDVYISYMFMKELLSLQHRLDYNGILHSFYF